MWVVDEDDEELLLCRSTQPNPTVLNSPGIVGTPSKWQLRYLSNLCQCVPALLRLARVAWALFFFFFNPSQFQFHSHFEFP